VPLIVKLAVPRFVATLIVLGLGVVGNPTTTPTAPSGPTMPVTAPTTPAEPASSVTPDDAAYVTDGVSSVVTRRKLPIYATPEFSPDTDTGVRLARRETIRVLGVVPAASGEPRLAIADGFISAASTDVRRPVVIGPNAKASLALDLDTNEILWDDDADAQLRIASVTKLLSIFVVRDWMASGEGSWRTIVTMADKNLIAMSRDWATGGFAFKRHGRYTVKQLYTLALVESSNAAITALGVRVAGSNTAFLDLMNTKAEQLGMDSSTFISVSGLDNKSLREFGLMAPGTTPADGNISTARDVGVMASALIATYPDVVETTTLAEVKIRSKKVKTTNQMLPGGRYEDKTLGITGLKTGYTSAAGYCLVATSATSGRHRVLAVILGSPSSDARFRGTRKLLHSIYDRWALSAP
jgi:D-alanyl-D-alanine carboxypeptidase